MGTYVLGVDLGTTAIKAGLFSVTGKTVATHTEEYTLLTPAPSVVEQTAETYWQAFSDAVKGVLKKAAVSSDQIKALSVSAQGETMAFLDENNEPLGNFIVWMDTRPQEEAEIINSWFDAKEMTEVTGQGPITSLYPACKILWMKNHQPETWNRTQKILLLEDYFFYRLGGKFYGEGSLWCTSYLWEIGTKRWWPEMLGKLGLREDQLPEIVETAVPIGTILPSVAEELGLSEDLILVMGGLDQACGAIGVGNVKPGVFSECTGAALVVATMTDHLSLDETGELPCFYGTIPGLYMLHAGAKGGIILRWLRDTICAEEMACEQDGGESAYRLMDEQAERIPAGSEGLTILPFWGGAGAPDTDQYAKGTIYGLSLTHTKAHIIRAVMEATAINIRRMVEYTEVMTGMPVTEVRSLGGGSMSPVWCQIKADALGIPVVSMKNTQDAACLGAALIAGVGAGIWPSVAEAAERLVEQERVYEPNPENKAAYDDLARRYQMLTSCLKGSTQNL